VFVSHAITNEKALDISFSFLKNSAVLIQGSSANTFENSYTMLQNASFVIVILSQEYCIQVENFTKTTDNSCGREFFEILSQLENPKKVDNIFITYQDAEGSYSQVVTSFVRNKLRKKTGEERFILKLSNWAALSTRVFGTRKL
jgi:hypothetical protein